MSHIICTGRLGKDAEIRTTSGGTKVAQFSLADDIGWGDKKKTQWLKCSLWGDRAEKLAPYLTKGSVVEIHGTPQVETWLKDGEAKGQLAVNVSDVKLHGGKRDESDRPVADSARATAAFDGDEVPF